MKKNYLFTALCAVLAISCNKNDAQQTNKVENKKVTVDFVLEESGKEQSTKSAAASGFESTITGINVFVFNSDGTLDVAGKANGNTVSLTVTTGQNKIAYAVVNPASDLSSSIEKESDLLAVLSQNISRLKGDEEFTMSGKTEKTDISTSTANINIPVDRAVAKISIDKITNGLNPALGSISIKKVFLSNVVTNAYLFKDDCGTEWAHKLGKNLTDYNWLCESGLSTSIENGKSDANAHYFYCCPNPTTEDSSDGTWCARHTRLVIEAQIGSKTYYYPISLNENISGGKIQKNKYYKIKELQIKHLGSEDPETPVESASVGFTIVINPWTDVTVEPIEM